MTLTNAVLGVQYTVVSIDTNNKEMDDFLFSLGCYSGQAITVVAHMANTYVVVIKDGRYSIDNRLADCITIK